MQLKIIIGSRYYISFSTDCIKIIVTFVLTIPNYKEVHRISRIPKRSCRVLTASSVAEFEEEDYFHNRNILPVNLPAIFNLQLCQERHFLRASLKLLARESLLIHR